MAQAIALKVGNVDVEVENQIVRMNVECIFCDDVLEVCEMQNIVVQFNPNSTPAQIENAFEDAILAKKDEFWPTMVLNRNNCVFFDVKRGAN